jgi:hypothetical protein
MPFEEKGHHLQVLKKKVGCLSYQSMVNLAQYVNRVVACIPRSMAHLAFVHGCLLGLQESILKGCLDLALWLKLLNFLEACQHAGPRFLRHLFCAVYLGKLVAPTMWAIMNPWTTEAGLPSASPIGYMSPHSGICPCNPRSCCGVVVLSPHASSCCNCFENKLWGKVLDKEIRVKLPNGLVSQPNNSLPSILICLDCWDAFWNDELGLASLAPSLLLKSKNQRCKLQ